MTIGREGFKPLANDRYFVVTVQEGLRFPVFDKEGFCVFLRDEFDIPLPWLHPVNPRGLFCFHIFECPLMSRIERSYKFYKLHNLH